MNRHVFIIGFVYLSTVPLLRCLLAAWFVLWLLCWLCCVSRDSLAVSLSDCIGPCVTFHCFWLFRRGAPLLVDCVLRVLSLRLGDGVRHFRARSFSILFCFAWGAGTAISRGRRWVFIRTFLWGKDALHSIQVFLEYLQTIRISVRRPRILVIEDFKDAWDLPVGSLCCRPRPWAKLHLYCVWPV